jgi:hypothetical protein
MTLTKTQQKLLQKSVDNIHFQAIKDKVNLEDSYIRQETPTLPKFEKPIKVKWSAGLWNLSRQLLP